jgi:hypothetical protein
MGKVSCSKLADAGRTAILLCSMATIGLVLAGAPRGYACAVDDEVDAVAEGILHEDEPVGTNEATKSMSCKLLVPGPHLKVTAPRAPTVADIERANEIRARARQALSKYEDYRVATQDGYHIVFPKLRQKRYHFSNPTNGKDSIQSFDPSRPTSLLYENQNGNYKLLGVMYTAPRGASEAELDRRFPISVAPWHLHTNVCVASAFQGRRQRFVQAGRFGARGSISTEKECAAAGGAFKPVVFGWMTHVDLYESYEKE